MTDKLLSVEIKSPEKEVWKGTAKSVSSINSAGPFDILPFHANFITIIENQAIKIIGTSFKEEYKFENAIIYASNNNVFIYTL